MIYTLHFKVPQSNESQLLSGAQASGYMQLPCGWHAQQVDHRGDLHVPRDGSQ